MRILLLGVLAFLFAACVPAPAAHDEVDAGPAKDFGSGRAILSYLEGKTLLMTGGDIPPYPFGIHETQDLGSNSQCYRAITTRVVNGAFVTTVEAGQLSGGSADAGSRCDHTTTTATESYTSKSLLIDNAKDNGGCFDIAVDYGAFAEEGRGRIAPDGTSVTLELYFRGKVTKDRCEDGRVGDPSTDFVIGQPDAGAGSIVPVGGDALQVYRIQY